MKTLMCKMENTLDGINSRLDIAENKINKCEGIVTELYKLKEEKDTQKLTANCELTVKFKMAWGTCNWSPQMR